MLLGTETLGCSMVGVNKSLKKLSAKVEGNSRVNLCRKEAILVRQIERERERKREEREKEREGAGETRQ
jgi:hypothetical protein